MLIVAGHFDVDPAEREKFIAERDEAMRKSRAEEGCHVYAMSPDPLDAGRVLLFERWESKEALRQHLEGLRSSPRPTSEIKMHGVEVLQYEVGEAGPVGS
ncbi:MAG: putative quinol monooxygenase [Thermoplasmata archaeon]